MTPEQRAHRTKLVLSFATIYLVWGSTYLATKIGVADLPPFLFGGVRFAVGGALLFCVACWLLQRKGSRQPRITGEEWRHLLVVGVCSVLISNGGNIWGLQYVPSNQAALLNVSSSFWIPIFGMFGARAARIRPVVALGLLTGFAGTLMIALPRAGATSALGSWPTLAILAGCIGWSLGTIYMRNVRTALDVMSFTGLQMFLGGMLMLLIGLALGEASRWQWSLPGLLALLYMMIFSSCIAYTAYAWLSIHAAPAAVGSYGFVNPLIAMGLGWLVLDERLGLIQVAGAVVILCGMLLVNWPALKAGLGGELRDNG